MSTNEVNYDFKIRDVLSINSIESKSINVAKQRLEYKQEVVDTITFVNTKAKIYYDVRYQSLLLKTKDKIYLRLYQKYQLSEKFNKKIFQQRYDLFLIKRRVYRLIYELDLSNI